MIRIGKVDLCNSIYEYLHGIAPAVSTTAPVPVSSLAPPSDDHFSRGEVFSHIEVATVHLA